MFDFSSHPFIGASLIISVVVLIIAGIISIIEKDSDCIVGVAFIHAILWVIIGFGYGMTLQ